MAASRFFSFRGFFLLFGHHTRRSVLTPYSANYGWFTDIRLSLAGFNAYKGGGLNAYCGDGLYAFAGEIRTHTFSLSTNRQRLKIH